MRQSLTVIFGYQAVIEAIHHKQEISTVYLQEHKEGTNFNELFKLIRERQIPYKFVSKAKLNRLINQKHQGIVAEISPIKYYQFDNLLPTLLENKKPPLILILDRITDVRNFGAIVRTAECAGVDAIIIPLKNSAKINSLAIKTSAGALYSVPVCRVLNLKNAIKTLRNKNIQIISAVEKTTHVFTAVNFQLPTAVIIGAEDTGISEQLLKYSDTSVKIPMKGNIKSLNVSVATAIILYEAVKQRT